MNEGFELHDSVVETVETTAETVVVRFRPAYIHRSEGRPGIDSGSGWLQDLDMFILGGVAESLPDAFPATLIDGFLSAGSSHWENLIPLTPGDGDPVRLSALTTEGETLAIAGRAAKVVSLGGANFLEAFPGD